jgi:hypothetical protein
MHAFSVVHSSLQVALTFSEVVTVPRPSSSSFCTASSMAPLCEGLVLMPRSVPWMACNNLASAAALCALPPLGRRLVTASKSPLLIFAGHRPLCRLLHCKAGLKAC